MDVPCATVLLDDVYSAATAAGGGDEDVCSLPVKVEKVVSHHLLVVSAGGEADGLAMEKERFTPVHTAGGLQMCGFSLDAKLFAEMVQSCRLATIGMAVQGTYVSGHGLGYVYLRRVLRRKVRLHNLMNLSLQAPVYIRR